MVLFWLLQPTKTLVLSTPDRQGRQDMSSWSTRQDTCRSAGRQAGQAGHELVEHQAGHLQERRVTGRAGRT